MPDVTARLPTPLSGRSAATSARIFNRGGRAIDYAIAGIPFLSMASAEHPYIIQTADMRKDQQDTEPEPGEQSLSGWWLRSQDSWHGGSGQDFQENRGTPTASIRFRDSSGVDVWDQNKAKLLRNMVQATATSSEAISLFATADALYLGLAGTVRSTTVGSGTATTSIGTVTGNVTDIAVGKEAWYAVSSNGSVYTKPLVGGSQKSFPLTNADTNFYTDNRLAWAKHRLWATRGRKVYVVDTTLADTTPSTAVYSYPTTDWSFTDIAEGPSAVYVSGWSETESSILLLTVEDDGGIPTLTAGRTTAIMPRGEKIQRISVLAGTWIGIATSRGFRVGAIDVNGDIQYGPLMLEPDNCVEAKAIAAWDRFFYVSWQTSDSVARVYRVDVSQQPEEDGVFAWAKDVEATGSAGYFSDLAVVGDGRVVAAFAAGAYPSQSAAKYWYQHATQLVPEGFIEFGKIRFRTTEPKVFKFVTLDIDPLAGSITLDAVLPNESLNRVALYNTQGKGEFEQSAFSSDLGPLRSMGLKMTLDRSVLDDTQGPVVHSYSIKAIDAVKPQRLIQLPLSCFDKEKWRTGQEDGGDGWAVDRLNALMAVEDGGDIFLYQDFSTGQGGQVKIEQLQFTQESTPVDVADPNRNSGGIITLVLRTMD